jgi:hypothetical protein
MPRIRCHYIDCVFIDNGHCSAAAVEIDPDTGCATYAPSEDDIEDDWEEDELEGWEEMEDEDDLWDEEDDDF